MSVAMVTAWTRRAATHACVTVASGPQRTRPCAWVRAPSCPFLPTKRPRVGGALIYTSGMETVLLSILSLKTLKK